VAVQLDCFVAPLLAMTSPNIKGDLSKNPKFLTADYADYADKSSYPNAPAGLEATTTLGIRFICAIRDGFFRALSSASRPSPRKTPNA